MLTIRHDILCYIWRKIINIYWNLKFYRVISLFLKFNGNSEKIEENRIFYRVLQLQVLSKLRSRYPAAIPENLILGMRSLHIRIEGGWSCVACDMRVAYPCRSNRANDIPCYLVAAAAAACCCCWVFIMVNPFQVLSCFSWPRKAASTYRNWTHSLGHRFGCDLPDYLSPPEATFS